MPKVATILQTNKREKKKFHPVIIHRGFREHAVYDDEKERKKRKRT